MNPLNWSFETWQSLEIGQAIFAGRFIERAGFHKEGNRSADVEAFLWSGTIFVRVFGPIDIHSDHAEAKTLVIRVKSQNRRLFP